CIHFSDYSDDDTDYPEGGYVSEPGIEFIKSAVNLKSRPRSGSVRPTLLKSASFSENEIDSESEFSKN
ncbi:unnamed protein product, partial [Allacma fusca]